MRIHSELCHKDENIAIVKVTGWENDKILGTSLGEANSAEEAEDRAIKRLINLLNTKKVDGTSSEKSNIVDSSNNLNKIIQQDIINNSKAKKDIETKSPREVDEDKIISKNSITEQKEPIDWSEELSIIDANLKRLCWDREKEGIYLDRAFGYKNRNMITEFSVIKKFVEALEKTKSGTKPEFADLPLQREDLMQKSNKLLSLLDWDMPKARTYLNSKFNCQTRQQLTDNQLSEFNKLLTQLLEKTENKNSS